ncbi:hypothetical protein HOH87_03135 [bacterium]|jgi:hypothetical protein|nr:hypothetical protein [bacterium]
MATPKRKVLFIEWATQGRDFEIDFPLMYFFEKYLDWEVHYCCVFDLWSIIRLKPDIVIMSNTMGGSINVKIAKLISKSGFFFVSHTSEGYFRENAISQMVWGHNTDQQVLVDMQTVWSNNAYQLAIKKFPNLSSVLRVSGSLGHDKYQIISSFVSIPQNKPYKKRILIAGYTFNAHRIEAARFNSIFGDKKRRQILDQGEKVSQLLSKLVREHPDIQFIIKGHPGDRGKLPLEAKEVKDLPNVIIIHQDYSIVDCITNSDLIMCFRSSIQLEAWLLGKPSIALCETQNLLSDSALTQGSYCTDSLEALDVTLTQLKENQPISEFEILSSQRDALISKMTGYSDGLNHIRFMSYLRPYIEGQLPQKKGRWKVTKVQKIVAFLRHIRMVYFPWTSKTSTTSHFHQNFSLKKLNHKKTIWYPDFDLFYETNKKNIDQLYRSYSTKVENLSSE